MPSSTVPASRRRCATGASTVHGPSASVARLPMRVGMPLVSTMSLMVIGTPSMSESRLPPFFQRFSEARAARSAASGSRCWKALSCGLNASMRASAARRRLDRRGLARLVELDQLVGRHHRKIGGHHLVSGRTGNFSGMDLGIARRRAQHERVLVMARCDLQADRQALAAHAARHRQRRDGGSG